MRTLTRYIGRDVLGATLVVFAALLMLFSFFDLINELGDVGRGNYTIVGAVTYVALHLPARLAEEPRPGLRVEPGPGADRLERHPPLERLVEADVDAAHPAAGEEPLDACADLYAQRTVTVGTECPALDVARRLRDADLRAGQ